MAAADPSSLYLVAQPGEPAEPCECTRAKSKDADRCPICHGQGSIPLPHRSGTAYIPKAATVLTLIAEILERREQTIVFSAFNDPLDHFSRWLNEANVRNVLLDGRVSQKRRGTLAAVFKRGRLDAASLPVMLASVECMAEGHSFHLANNVILMAYSWAADKLKQALDRVHRMNSVKPINVFVVLCNSSIDRRLESLTQEKTDAAELVLDGRLIGERTEEVNLAELLKVARREFNDKDNTLDEELLQTQWPKLRQRLDHAMRRWIDVPAQTIPARDVPDFIHIRPLVMLPANLRGVLTSYQHGPLESISVHPVEPARPSTPAPSLPEPFWKARCRARCRACR